VIEFEQLDTISVEAPGEHMVHVATTPMSVSTTRSATTHRAVLEGITPPRREHRTAVGLPLVKSETASDGNLTSQRGSAGGSHPEPQLRGGHLG
jgi:hypothetical protein